MKRSLALFALTALTLTGCSNSPDDEAGALGRVDSIDALHDAYVAAGGECDRVDQDPGSLAEESLMCSSNTILLTFATANNRDGQVDRYEELASVVGEVTLLVGDNWIVNSPTAADVQDALGGEVVILG